MLKSWKLGTVFGIRIYIHWTFLLLPAFAFWRTARAGGAELALFAATFVVVVFGCVLLHELGHALMARHFGIPTRDITLYPIGGVARLERMGSRPWEEFWIAVAGPAVNVAIALILLVIVAPMSLLANWQETDVLSGAAGFLVLLFIANVGLVAFNMLPAFPMDGGRVLRALLAARWGHLRATEIAATLGVFMAWFFILWGMLSAVVNLPFGSPLLILVGFFVYMVGQQELAMVRHREAVRRAAPIDVIPVPEELLTVLPAAREQNFSGFTWDSRAGMWVRWHNGRPVQAIAVDQE